MALVHLTITFLVFRILWGFGGALPEMLSDAAAAGDYKGVGVMAFIAFMSLLIGVDQIKNAYQLGFKTVTGEPLGVETVKLEVGTAKLEEFLEEVKEMKEAQQERQISVMEPELSLDFPAPAFHFDERAVDFFALNMRMRLQEKRLEGRTGWETDEFSDVDLADAMQFHAHEAHTFEEGTKDPKDYLDTANYAMFLWHRHNRGVVPASEAEKTEE